MIIDLSTRAAWRCTTCRRPHAPGAGCVRAGVWLVLALCNDCHYASGRYCRAHRG